MEFDMIRVGTVLRQFALTLLVGCGMICFGGSICFGQAAANPADTVQIPNPPQSLSSGPGRSLARSTSAPIIKHRIKDITRLSSDRTNRLSGLGLVLGLGNGGSKSADTAQALRNYYKNNEIIIEDVAEGGAALVTVSLDVPANYRPGEKLIGTVAASDESTSLYGGVLVSTILRVYPDGEGYAVASGPLTVGGFSVGGEGASVTKNHPTKAKVSVQIERKLQNESPFSSKTFDLSVNHGKKVLDRQS
jgi:flagellar basal body P-ring protein FlgI